MSSLAQILNEKPGSRVLLALAAPREMQSAMEGLGIWRDVMPEPWACVRDHHRFDLVRTGVGKSNGAGAVARVLDPDRHIGVLSAGIAGALPSGSSGGGLEIGEIVCATESVFADEGIGTRDGFTALSDIGFGCFPDGSMGASHDGAMIDLLSPHCGASGKIATVSWCSGADACARGVVDRTGALAEAMEGAAVALSARRVSASIATGELRVISNTTGDRDGQRWDLEGALARLGDVLGRLATVLD